MRVIPRNLLSIRPRMPRRGGFTLIELLVVIAIIGVLISILIPVLSRARESGRTAKCLSNMRQISAALGSYATDNSDCLVPGDHKGIADGFGSNGGGSWADTLAINRYITVPILRISHPGEVLAGYDELYERDNILRCASGTPENVLDVGYPTSQIDPRGAMSFARAADTTLIAVRTWYGANMLVDPRLNNFKATPFSFLPEKMPAGGNDWHLNRLFGFTDPSKMPLIFDGIWMLSSVNKPLDPAMINARHGGRRTTNVLFADGHCENLFTETLPNDDWYLPQR